MKIGRRVENIKATKKSLLVQNLYSKRAWQNGSRSAELVTAVWVPKQTRISTTFGTHVWPVHTPRYFFLFTCTYSKRAWQNGRQCAESSSQCFVCLNVLGFQQRLASICGLAICPDRFCCLPLLKQVRQNGCQTSGVYFSQSSKICRRQIKIGGLVENIKTNKKFSWG